MRTITHRITICQTTTPRVTTKIIQTGTLIITNIGVTAQTTTRVVHHTMGTIKITIPTTIIIEEMDKTSVRTATPTTVITTGTTTTRITSTIEETGITEPEIIGNKSII